MTIGEKLIKMFIELHGEPKLSCSAKVRYADDEMRPIGVNLMKNGEIAWYISKEDLLFWYVTRDM